MGVVEDNIWFDRTCVEINKEALISNMKEIRRITRPEADILAVVKADAYGHGDYETASTLLKNGANGLCIATIGEAVMLRKKGINARMLILGGTAIESYEDAVRFDINLAIYDRESAEALSKEAVKQGKTADIHIKLDTGMGRIGFPSDGTATKEIASICRLPGLNPYGVFSHFAVADTNEDEYTFEQFNKFMAEVERLKAEGINFEKRHICNSAGILRFPQMHLDMVRAGLILYGLKPDGCPEGYTDINLTPVMTWYSKVVHVKTVPAGTTVSYGRHFTANRESKIATLAVGYADGLSRCLSNGFELLIDGEMVPIVGNICMDMCMVDATDMKNDIKVGDIVTIFGKDRPASELAEKLGTISYEITCDVGKRVKRVFV